jgi:hypothetical protein
LHPVVLAITDEATERALNFAAVHESGSVEGFGCWPIAAMRLAPWPASESLQ